MAKNKGLSFIQKKKRISSETIREIFVTVFYIFVAVLAAFVLVFSFGLKTSMIGVSMEPTLQNGQKVLINRFVYKLTSPKRGDVIAFLPGGNQNSHYYLKRVVGLPGETIKIEKGVLYIDSIALAESEQYGKIVNGGVAENEITLGNDEYFVLGDNRNNSEDSRFDNIGNVNKNTIIGKVWFSLPYEDGGMGFIE